MWVRGGSRREEELLEMGEVGRRRSCGYEGEVGGRRSCGGEE